MSDRAALDPGVHRMAKAVARNRGEKLQAYIDSILRPAVTRDFKGRAPALPDPFHEFLRNVMEAVWTDWFEAGPHGWEIEASAYFALPTHVKLMVQSLEPFGEDRLRVTTVSKEWAMKVAAEIALGDCPRAYTSSTELLTPSNLDPEQVEGTSASA